METALRTGAIHAVSTGGGRAVSPLAKGGDPIFTIAARKRISRLSAQLSTLFGRPRGFFIQYEYARQAKPVSLPYREVESLLAKSPWQGFLADMASHVAEFETFAGESDPRWNQGRMLAALDGAAAFAAVRRYRPKRVVEIGSGDSTYFLVKAGASVTCIDPAPRRSIAALGVELLERPLADSDVALAASLEADDILFIDSSHILLPGTDVDIEFNRMFPVLQSGVVVHVHDIFLPDDYPASWRGRYYAEQNALIGWIMSGYFDVVWPGHYVATRHALTIREAFRGFGPVQENLEAGSIWLRRR